MNSPATDLDPSKRVWVQYHNTEKQKHIPGCPPPYNGKPLDGEGLPRRRHPISVSWAKRSLAQQAIGGTIYLVAGWGVPRKYVLWSKTTPRELYTNEWGEHEIDLYGEQFIPDPAPRIEGPELTKLLGSTKNISSFCDITGSPAARLFDSLTQGIPPKPLRPTIPRVYEFNETESERLERERIERSILDRRGQAEFREMLMIAYGRRCVVSGSRVEQVLEAAHIRPVSEGGRDVPSNGLILRSDIHTLFDLDLITIDPDTLRVSLAPNIKDSSYNKLAMSQGRRILRPIYVEAKPDRDALRWRAERSRSRGT
jgi:hypothetical protein